MVETLRSLVHPWECDSVDHFTTAFYYQAFGAARRNLLQRIGCSPEAIAALRPASCVTAFKRELRAGDVYHIESGVLGQSETGITIGHRLWNSETGELSTTDALTLEGRLPPVGREHGIEPEVEDPGAELDFAAPGRWPTTSISLVRERDLDDTGRLELSALIHHASDASVQFQNMLGMTSSYMLENRIGYATFAYRLRLFELPRAPGAVLRTESSLARLGRSSLWFAHRTLDDRTGQTVAEIAQFGVHLDRAARRAAELPREIRERAEGFLSGG